MSDRLINAILSMDAYNRGYGAAIAGLKQTRTVAGVTIVERIGNVVLLEQELPAGSEQAGFFAQAYKLDNVIIDGVRIKNQRRVAFRGTDDTADISNGWPLGGGAARSTQGLLAIEFYRTVAGRTNNPYDANITTTGHSLGGGLAGYIAGIYGKSATMFDTMAFEDGVANTYSGLIYGFGDPAENAAYRQLVLGGVDLKAPDVSRISAVETVGQILSGPGYVGGVTSAIPLEQYNTLSGAGNVGTPDALQKHSIALLVNLIYAADNEATLGTNWKLSAPSLWKAYFNGDVAAALPTTSKDGQLTAGSGSQLGLVQSAIGYSAIKSGTRPFGDTAIDAIFDDAGDLGEVLAPNNAAAIVKDNADAIANTFVEYAGGLALGQVTGGKFGGSQWRPQTRSRSLNAGDRLRRRTLEKSRFPHDNRW